MIYVAGIILFSLYYQFLLSHSTAIPFYKQRNSRLSFCLVAGLIFYLLLLLKHDLVGSDTQNYHWLFDYVKDNGDDAFIGDNIIVSEIGFYKLLLFCSKLGDFKLLLGIVYLLYIGVFVYYIFKYSNNVWLSFFLFLTTGYFMFACTMRQCIAWSILLIALQFALRKKFLLYMFTGLLASLFHVSAIIFLPVYFICNDRLTWKQILFFLLILVVILFSTSSIMRFLFQFSGKDYYFKMETGGIVTLLLHVGYAIWAFYLFSMKRLGKMTVILMKLNFIILLLFPFAFFNPAFFRIYKYFDLVYVLLIPNLISTITHKKIRLVLALLFVLYGSFNFFIQTPRTGVRNLPYVFFWENYYEKNPEARSLDLMYY